MVARILSALAVLLTLSDAHASERLTLARVFGDHMVLQRDQPILLWGEADAGARVLVEFGPQEVEVLTSEEGHWRVTLGALPAGGPHVVRVSCGPDQVELDDVLVGDVWLCAGQSNMRWPLRSCEESKEALAQASRPNLRLLDFTGVGQTSARAWSAEVLASCTPEDYYQTEGWEVSSPSSAAPFSGVAWFFGSALVERTEVPIGLIHNAIGGTCVEAYISPASLERAEHLARVSEGPGWLDDPLVPEWPRGRARQNLAGWLSDPVGLMPGHPFEPGFLYRAGIAPLQGLGLAGVVWYQGESNATGADMQVAADPAHAQLGLETLIDDWRHTLGRPNLPFLLVQLPAMERSWMEYREVQRQVAQRPGVELAVTLDLGDPRDVHPRRKRAVGERLADLALHGLGLEGSEATLSPRVRSAWQVGRKAIVQFDSRGGGPRALGGEQVGGLELQGEDGDWHLATGVLRQGVLEAVAEGVRRPVAVRYAWAPVPRVSLCGSTGAPVSPFREPLLSSPPGGR